MDISDKSKPIKIINDFTKKSLLRHKFFKTQFRLANKQVKLIDYFF